MTRTRAGAGPLHSPAGYRRDLYAVEADLGITVGEIGLGVSRATGGGTSTCMQYRHQFVWTGLSIHQKVVCRGYPAIHPCICMYPGGGTPIVLLYTGIVKPKLFFS